MITVLYHGDADGIGAAYALYCRYGGENEMIFTPVQYGQPVPTINPDTKKLYIVDFSYNCETCEMLKSAFGDVTIIDHHKTAMKDLEDLDYAIFDMTKSGCQLTWEYCYPQDTQIPDILKYISDRDMWKWELPFSREVNAYIAIMDIYTCGSIKAFQSFNLFNLDAAMHMGEAIKAFQNNQIAYAMKRVEVLDHHGFDVPMVNLTENVSEMGEAMCKAYPDALFSVSFFIFDGGKVKFSLRSIGDRFDCGIFCKSQGGGGHFNAAGYISEPPD